MLWINTHFGTSAPGIHYDSDQDKAFFIVYYAYLCEVAVGLEPIPEELWGRKKNRVHPKCSAKPSQGTDTQTLIHYR